MNPASLRQQLVGMTVATYTNPRSENARPRSVGRCVGYFTEPAVIVEYDGGQREAWSARLVEVIANASVVRRPVTLRQELSVFSAAELAAAMERADNQPGPGGDWSSFALAVLRELNKPPRIPEPTGKYAVVEAACVHTDTRHTWSSRGDGLWYPLTRGDEPPQPDDWDSLVDPVLVREGIDG